MPHPELPPQVCDLLAVAEELAFLLVDNTGRVGFASPSAQTHYGIAAPALPVWLAEASARFQRALEKEMIHRYRAEDARGRQVEILSRRVDEEQTLTVLRRPNEVAGAYHPLTGLFSESEMRQRLADELVRIQRYPDALSLLAIWPEEGTALSADLVDLMRIHFRGADILGHAPGNGFWVILPNTDEAQARLAATRFMTLVSDWRTTTPGLGAVRVMAIEAHEGETPELLGARLARTELQVA